MGWKIFWHIYENMMATSKRNHVCQDIVIDQYYKHYNQ